MNNISSKFIIFLKYYVKYDEKNANKNIKKKNHISEYSEKGNGVR